MTEREKVIKGFELCLTPNDRREYDDADVCHTECPYFRAYNMGDCIRALAKDALTLLKAQEPIEARLHLCDSCTKLYPECDATADGIEFGCGFGKDNIIGCTAYENRWKAQEPVTVIPAIKRNDELLTEGICPICGAKLDYYLNGQFCGCCGRRIKWE